MVIVPEFLSENDFIGVTAPSDGNSDEGKLKKFDYGIKKLEKRGFKIKCSPDCRTSEKGRSASASIRAAEFMEQIEDREIGAMILAKGGDYLVETLKFMDFDKIRKNPKWIQGYSDPTGILHAVTVNSEVATIYGHNFAVFGNRKYTDDINSNLNLLTGGMRKYSFPNAGAGIFKEIDGERYFIQNGFDMVSTHFPNGKGVFSEFNVDTINYVSTWNYEKGAANGKGKSTASAEGIMLGGCIDVLVLMCGTKYDKTREFIKKNCKEGVLWYFESFAFNSETLTLALWQLKEAGWFENAKGFIFGRPTFYHSGYKIKYEESVMASLAEITKDEEIPVFFNADISHYPPRMSVVNGVYGRFEVKRGSSKLMQPLC